MVQRRLDEGGVRQFHGGEDREPLVSAGESRTPLPALELSAGIPGGSDRRRQPDPSDADQPDRRGAAVRTNHLSEGADRDAPARADRPRDDLPRWPARIPEKVLL